MPGLGICIYMPGCANLWFGHLSPFQRSHETKPICTTVTKTLFIRNCTNNHNSLFLSASTPLYIVTLPLFLHPLNLSWLYDLLWSIKCSRSNRPVLSLVLKRFCMLPLLFLESCDYYMNKPRRICKYMKHIQVILAEAILDQPASIQFGSWSQMCEWPQSKPKELPSLGWTKMPNHRIMIK